MMRGLTIWIALLWASGGQVALADNTAAEAQAIGSAAAGAVQADFSAQPAIDQTPGYQAVPPEASLDLTNLTNSTSNLLALCQTTPSDPSCEAILQARADALVKTQTPSLIGDPNVQSALAVQGALLGGVAAGYSGCATDTTTTGSQYYTTQSCFSYAQRAPDLECINILRVKITGWHCLADASGPYIDGTGAHYCNRFYGYNYDCSGPNESLTYSAEGYPVCATSTIVPPSLIPKITVRPADETAIIYPEPAIPEIYKYWERGCASLEARVPTGMLPPDGDNNPIGGGTTTSAVDSCMRSNTFCSDVAPATRTFDTVPVTATCWAYTNTFDCLNPATESDCNTNQWGQCSPEGTGTGVCIEYDPVNPSSCTTKRYDYSCLSNDTRKVSLSANCAGQVFTDDYGTQWGAGSLPNQDLPKAVAIMEAGREAGMYMGADYRLFTGMDNRCTKKLFGLVNCCTKTGGLNLEAFSNASVAMAAVSTGGKALASTYTFDALFASDAPQWLVNGFQSLFGEGYSSILAGAMAGDIAVDQLLSSLVPGPWSIAMMAIQLSGLTSCPQSEKIVSMKRGGNLCVDLGDYCSKEFKALFFKVCLERTQTACCFNSKLAKAINVQGKAQLGISMGSAENPNCQGFTVTDFQRLDLSSMDFSEFIEQIQAQAIDTAATVGRTDPLKCYYGTNGQCN